MVRPALLCVLLLLAGCTGPVAPATNGTTTDCGGHAPVGESLSDRYDVRYGAADGFRLTVHPETVARGERFTVRLRNAAESTDRTAAPRKYAIHRWHDGEWHPVLGRPGTPNATAREYAPGETHVWSLAANESGVTNGRVAACGPVETGRYRFVHFGVDNDSALAVRFTVTEA